MDVDACLSIRTSSRPGACSERRKNFQHRGSADMGAASASSLPHSLAATSTFHHPTSAAAAAAAAAVHASGPHRSVYGWRIRRVSLVSRCSLALCQLVSAGLPAVAGSHCEARCVLGAGVCSAAAPNCQRQWITWEWKPKSGSGRRNGSKSAGTDDYRQACCKCHPMFARNDHCHFLTLLTRHRRQTQLAGRSTAGTAPMIASHLRNSSRYSSDIGFGST